MIGQNCRPIFQSIRMKDLWPHMLLTYLVGEFPIESTRFFYMKVSCFHINRCWLSNSTNKDMFCGCQPLMVKVMSDLKSAFSILAMLSSL